MKKSVQKEIELEVLVRSRKFKKSFGDIYKELRSRYGLKQVEVEVLLYLGLMPEVSSTELARALSLQKGHVSMAMAGLCEKGYLRSEHSAKDKRFVRFIATEEGLKVRKEIEKIQKKLKEQLLDGFSDDELRELDVLGQKILRNMENLKL